MGNHRISDEEYQEVKSLIENFGENEIPIMIVLYKKGINWINWDLTKFLYKNNWEPDEQYIKIEFYERFERWDKLIEIGAVESACRMLYYGRNKKWNELVELKQLAVPFLVKLCYNSYEKDNAEKLILEIGKPAIPYLVEFVKTKKIDYLYQEYFCNLLLKLEWKPENIEEKVFFYRILSKYDEIRSLGEEAIPVIVNNWLKGGRDRRILARILKEFNWLPESNELQKKFFEDTNQFEKLVAFGESALPVLFEEERWDLILEIGEPAISYLKQALGKIKIRYGMLSSQHERYENIGNTLITLGWLPESIDEKLKFFVELKAWKELKKLGEPGLKILLEHKRFLELEEIKDISIPFLVNTLLKETTNESWDAYNPQNSQAFKCLNYFAWVPSTTEEKLAYNLYKGI